MDTDLTAAALAALRNILERAELENRKLAAATGLTPSQGLVLRQVCARETITPGTIAGALGFSQASVTNIVDRLVAQGLVTRNRSPHDKRQILLQPTPEGVERLKASPFPLQLRFSEGFDRLPSWEQAMLLAALERMKALLTPDEESAPAPRPEA